MSKTPRVQLKVRMPHELHEEIVEAAQANERSVNGEIVFRLQQLRDRKQLVRELAEELRHG